MNQLKGLLIFFGIGIFIFPLFQNCEGSPNAPFVEEAVEVPSTATGCDEQLFEYFESTYHPLFQTVGCNKCHNLGGIRQVSAFAQDDAFAGFWHLKERGPQAVVVKIVEEGHNSSTLAYDKEALGAQVSEYLSGWQETEKQCLLSELSVTTEGLLTDFFDPDRVGLNASDNCNFNDAVALEAVTGDFSSTQPRSSILVWDLGALREDLAGVTVSIEVKANDPGIFKTLNDADPPVAVDSHACPNEKGYRVGRVRFTSPVNLRVKNMRVQIDGDDKGVRDFLLEKNIPAGSEELDIFGVTSSFVNFPMAIFDGAPIVASNSWSLFFEEVEVMPPAEEEEEGSDEEETPESEE